MNIPTWYDSERLARAALGPEDAPSMPGKLLVILSGGGRCDLLKAIVDTWGRSLALVVIMDADCVLPTDWKQTVSSVNLNIHFYNFDDNPNNSDDSHHLFHFIDHFIFGNFEWYLFVPFDTYVNIWRLQRLLGNFRSFDDHLFGGKVYGKQNSSYCLTGPGFVISQSLFDSIINRKQTCYSATAASSILSNIENCLVERLNLKCSNQLSKRVNYFRFNHSNYFFQGKDFFEDFHLLSSVSNFAVLDDFEHYSTIHPVKSVYTFNKLHHYYTELEYNRTQRVLKNLKTSVHYTFSKLKNMDNSKYSYPNLSPGQYPPYETYPQNIYEMQTWTYFDSMSFYKDEMIEPQKPLWLYNYHSIELNNILLEAVRLANINYPSPLVFHKLLNGYMKHDGQKGNTYIVDIQLKEQYNPFVIIQRRFSFLRPLSLHYEILPSKNSINEAVNLVVPVTKVNDRLGEFLKMYEQVALISGQRTHLVLVTYTESDQKYCKSKISYYTKKYPSSRFTIVQGEGDFARAKALDKGISVLDNNDLIFISDVDMEFDEQFLERCRLNTIQGQQVYYPEVFKMYNMKYVYKAGMKPGYLGIMRKNGHWCHYGYGMLCLYRSDYIAVGGLDTSFVGWGGEDVEFYEKILRHKYKVLRAPDPALIHKWHPKHCHKQEGSKQSSCLSSQSEVLADRRELAQYVYELEKNNTHIFCI